MSEVKRLKYCVDGEWAESSTSRWMAVTDSSTGEVIAQAPACTAEEVRAAIDSADRAFPAWADKPIAARTQVLYRWKALIEHHIEELTRITAMELGKNLDEARGEYIKIIEACETAVAAPMLMQGRSLMNVSAGSRHRLLQRAAGGLRGHRPLQLPGHDPLRLDDAPGHRLTGNTFVLKAATMVPLSAMRCLELLYEAGLPKGVVNLVTCSRTEADILLTHPAVRGVSFVGSTPTGLARLLQGGGGTASGSRPRPRPRTTASC